MRYHAILAVTWPGILGVVSLSLGVAVGHLPRTDLDGGTALRSVANQDDAAFAAANLELMVLRVSLPDRDRGEDTLVSIDPNQRTLTASEAAEALARMPKPVSCTASFGASRVLSVKCKLISDLDEHALHGSLIRGFDDRFGLDASTLPDDERRFLVRGSGSTLNLSMAAFRRWYQDYQPPGSVALGFDRSPAATRQAGYEVAAVITLLHVDPANPDDLPPELSFLRH